MAEIEGRSGWQEIGAYLFAQAVEYYERGDQKGENSALLISIAAYRAALEESTRDRVPLQWATTQNNLGTALQTLGSRERGTARLEEAVAAYRAALEEMTRDRVPLDWAATQMNLGNALQTLGSRESGTARVEESVVAYRARAGGKDAGSRSARLGGDAEQSRHCTPNARIAGERDGAC